FSILIFTLIWKLCSYCSKKYGNEDMRKVYVPPTEYSPYIPRRMGVRRRAEERNGRGIEVSRNDEECRIEVEERRNNDESRESITRISRTMKEEITVRAGIESIEEKKEEGDVIGS
ncbi:hypothetical protein PMAYCL1PPCAC_18030, partial [Pristionchus mayeri]